MPAALSGSLARATVRTALAAALLPHAYKQIYFVTLGVACCALCVVHRLCVHSFLNHHDQLAGSGVSEHVSSTLPVGAGGHYVPSLASALLDAQQGGGGLPLRDNGKSFITYISATVLFPPLNAGGHYVPNLASALLDAQQEGALPLRENGKPVLNLQGFLVGNAWTDPEIDNRGASAVGQ